MNGMEFHSLELQYWNGILLIRQFSLHFGTEFEGNNVRLIPFENERNYVDMIYAIQINFL